MLKTINLKIKGIHCASCKTLIETEIDVLAGVNKVEVNHQTGDAKIEFDNAKITEQDIFKEIKKLNYEPILADQKILGKTEETEKESKSEWKQILLGLAIPLGLMALFLGYLQVQKLGGFEILSRLNEGNVSYGIIFVIGILAGFHCVGMCGGLVVAYSSSSLKNNIKSNLTPHWQYNLGRLISYTVIGGILGGLGSFFGVNPIFTGIITLFAGVFMVIMGLSFLGNSALLEKIKLRTPQFIAKFLYNQKHSENPKGPFMVGLLNGFMPCGPLQAMQLYALASGSVLRGGMSMGIYALGTIPLMFGFGAFISRLGQKQIKNIIKISGILVLILGLFMIGRGLASFGFNISFSSGNNGSGAEVKEQEIIKPGTNFQEVRMKLGYYGYEPNTLYIKKGIPVRWIIDADQISGCTNAILVDSLGIRKDLVKGENIIEFTPPDGVSEIKFSCWMRMVWGKFIIQN